MIRPPAPPATESRWPGDRFGRSAEARGAVVRARRNRVRVTSACYPRCSSPAARRGRPASVYPKFAAARRPTSVRSMSFSMSAVSGRSIVRLSTDSTVRSFISSGAQPRFRVKRVAVSHPASGRPSANGSRHRSEARVRTFAICSRGTFATVLRWSTPEVRGGFPGDSTAWLASAADKSTEVRHAARRKSLIHASGRERFRLMCGDTGNATREPFSFRAELYWKTMRAHFGVLRHQRRHGSRGGHRRGHYRGFAPPARFARFPIKLEWKVKRRIRRAKATVEPRIRKSTGSCGCGAILAKASHPSSRTRTDLFRKCGRGSHRSRDAIGARSLPRSRGAR